MMSSNGNNATGGSNCNIIVAVAAAAIVNVIVHTVVLGGSLYVTYLFVKEGAKTVRFVVFIISCVE